MTSKIIIITPENHGTSEKEYMVSGREAGLIRSILDIMCDARMLGPEQKRLTEKQ